MKRPSVLIFFSVLLAFALASAFVYFAHTSLVNEICQNIGGAYVNSQSSCGMGMGPNDDYIVVLGGSTLAILSFTWVLSAVIFSFSFYWLFNKLLKKHDVAT